MEPNLFDGDIVLVRKADFHKTYWNQFYRYVLSKISSLQMATADDEKTVVDRIQNKREDVDDGRVRGTNAAAAYLFRDEHENITIESLEERNRYGGPMQWTPSYPPRSPPGALVVFKSPNDFPVKYCVKRVIAQGGQSVRPASRKRYIERVPSNCIWVEGDNIENSEDSCTYGPVNKKLLVGQVEKVIWPPSRWGLIEQIMPKMGRAWGAWR
eukprot:CAMPEP_0195514818 /NCGR_PEP_ID=MMETSP0794_2-20130614/6090_1 /TAXON_ID=515487 /ORGANISM="Stephanopyxis turris, Strain CCMP 815" /LENGTH=211 /DNA_ID=CAMNT_0040643143 /DNA_START=159 /DNA_END=794 /DNA_ORIENTATION=+